MAADDIPPPPPRHTPTQVYDGAQHDPRAVWEHEAFIGATSASLQADAERRERQQRKQDLDFGALAGKYHVAKQTITYLSRWNVILISYCFTITIIFAVVLIFFATRPPPPPALQQGPARYLIFMLLHILGGIL